VYKLNGSQKRELRLAPSRIHGHQRLHKRSVEPNPVTGFTDDGLIDGDSEERSRMAHEALDGILFNLIHWWFGPEGAPSPTPTSGQVQTTASAVAQPSATNSAIPHSGGATSEFSRIGYYDSATQHLDGLTFLGNHGGDGSGAFDL
jgi:hypothetical protein